MPWFAAHAIVYFKLKSGSQDRFTVWENVYLIEAQNKDEAWEKAETWARQQESYDDDSLKQDGQSATSVFAGIRKLMTVFHWEEEGRLRNGDEITFSEFQVPDEESIRELVKGEEVSVEYID